MDSNVKYCAGCGNQISADTTFCPKCGKATSGEVPQAAAPQPAAAPVAQPAAQPAPQVIINNSNTLNANMFKKEKNKWIALVLCFFFGFIGFHKFYEGKVGMGILYIFTVGLFGIGVIIDFFVLLFKPNPYYV